MSKMVAVNLRMPFEMKKQIELVCEAGSLFGNPKPLSDFIRVAITEKLQQYPIHKIQAQKDAAVRAAKREEAKQAGGL